jgi:hypothetical protein
MLEGAGCGNAQPVRASQVGVRITRCPCSDLTALKPIAAGAIFRTPSPYPLDFAVIGHGIMEMDWSGGTSLLCKDA